MDAKQTKKWEVAMDTELFGLVDSSESLLTKDEILNLDLQLAEFRLVVSRLDLDNSKIYVKAV